MNARVGVQLAPRKAGILEGTALQLNHCTYSAPGKTELSEVKCHRKDRASGGQETSGINSNSLVSSKEAGNEKQSRQQY